MTATAETQAPDAAYQQLAEHLAERNAELVEEKFALIERLDVAESRVQALAAQIERMVNAACSEGAGPKMRDAIDEASTTTLARLIAGSKAEALHDLLMHPRRDGTAICQQAVKLRDEYRRQAEKADTAREGE